MIVALTDYAQEPVADEELLTLLGGLYSEVILWPQGAGDLDYVRKLGARPGILDGDLDSFDDALRDPETDYVGTRLHAGIRALQLGTRSTIIEVDNRAREMGRDIGLPVVSRGLHEDEREFISGPRDVTLSIPHGAIAQWDQATRAWAAQPIS